MAMLAERKQKQKWSLNPRGKDWSQDANKFGQKMLEKMGWQHGKGLGAKEDGITENIKVSYKNDSKGMGFKETNDQWTEHESNFSALLESLTGKESTLEGVQVSSLEKKSQTSRARVHYHKFTRGKDLSRASEKDLANIFGKKSLKNCSKKQVVIDEEVSSPKESENKSGFLKNAGSMRDYFKKKMPNFGKTNGYVVGNNGVLRKDESESESECKPCFGFGFNNFSAEASSIIKEESKSDINNSQNSSLNKSKKSTFYSYISENGDKKRKTPENEDISSSPKKKTKKEKQTVEETLGLSNAAFNPMATPIKIQKHLLDPIQESITEETEEPLNISDSHSEKKKNKKNKKDSTENLNLELEESPKKKKKSNKNVELLHEFSNPNFSIQVADSKEESNAVTNPYEIVMPKLKKNKNSSLEENREMKSKKEKQIIEETLGVSNPAFNPMATPIKIQKHLLDPIQESITEETEEHLNISDSFSEKKKNKKNKKDSTENLNLELEESPKKKKKSNKNVELSNEFSNPNFNIEVADSKEEVNAVTNPYEIVTTKLKKNKNSDSIEENREMKSRREKKKQKTLAIHNLNFDETENTSSGNLAITENPYEIKTKKIKKKKINSEDIKETESKNTTVEIDNPNFNITEDTCDVSQNIENPYEVKSKKNKKQKKLELDNPNFDETDDTVTDTSQLEENPYEIKPREKKKKAKSKVLAIDNPSFVDQEEKSIDNINPYEVRSKKKKQKIVEDSGIPNPALDLNDTKTDESVILEECELMLNVISTPVIPKPDVKVNSVVRIIKTEKYKNRKSVRFSDVTQELIIPNNEELKNMFSKDERSKNKKKRGLDNLNFDKSQNNLDENVETISKTLDNYQAEIENDMNEEKIKTVTVEDLMVGEVGNPHGENEKLPNGTKLKFKYANLEAKTPFYELTKIGPKKSYKHLIKGDILIKFKNTNLHKVTGYGVREKK